MVIRSVWAAWGRCLWMGAALLAGCASPGDQPAPRALLGPTALGLDFKEAATEWPDQSARALGSLELDALIEEALMGQPGVHGAQARLARAVAGVDAVQGSQQLQSGLSVDTNRQQFSAHGLVPSPLAGSVRSTAAVRLAGAIELDFWGRHDAALRAALGQERAARAELQAVRTVLVAHVARAYIGLARAGAMLELADEAIEQRRAVLALTQQRRSAGLENQIALQQAEAALAQARAQREEAQGQVAEARHQLAVLVGRGPEALATLMPRLEGMQPMFVPERLSVDLLGRRAEILAARWRVEASIGARDYTRTLFYPNLHLGAFVGLDALGVQRLLEPGSRTWGLAPALRLPIFDGGQLRAQLRGRGAELDEAIAAYNGAVLEAVREAADAQHRLHALAQQQAEQMRARHAAEEAVRLARQRFEAGLGSYLPVLAADAALLTQRVRARDLQAQHLVAQVLLMQAVGGAKAADRSEKFFKR